MGVLVLGLGWRVEEGSLRGGITGRKRGWGCLRLGIDSVLLEKFDGRRITCFYIVHGNQMSINNIKSIASKVAINVQERKSPCFPPPVFETSPNPPE